MTQVVIMAAYLALLVVLGAASNRLFRGTAQDYFLASHSIGPVLLLMSIFGTTMTAFTLVGQHRRGLPLGHRRFRHAGFVVGPGPRGGDLFCRHPLVGHRASATAT